MAQDLIIEVDGLGKRYQIGHEVRHDTLRDALSHRAKGILSGLRSFGRRAASNYEDFWALRGISFEVKRGEVLGVIGRNGAGKSTLLKILSRITEPTEGVIRIRGRAAALLEVGTGFHPELTGRENIYLNGAILGMTRAEIVRKFDEIVEFAEVEKFIDTPVKRYSSGMYVRLAFAVAAHLEPEILIVDEVLAVGDAAFQKKCLGKMRDVAQGEGRTVLFVSHNMGAVTQLTDRCMVLNGGRLEFLGDTESAIERYFNLGAGSMSTVYDVEHAPRKYQGSQAARIISLKLEKSVSQFGGDEDFSFLIQIRANEDLRRLRTSITIFSIEGMPVGACFSSDHREMKSGEVREFRIVLAGHRLAPGHYYCDVGIGKGGPRSGHVDYDVVQGVVHFEVMALPGIEGSQSFWTSGWGRIIFPELQMEGEVPVDA